MTELTNLYRLAEQQPTPPLDSNGSETPHSIDAGQHNHGPQEPPFVWALSRERGHPSVIAEYCQQAIENGHEECIWLCMKRGRRFIVKDLPLKTDGKSIGLYDIRKQCSWWKRHSLYSVLGVKEILVSSLHLKSRQEIRAVPMEFDYPSLTAYLNKSIEATLEQDMEPLECGVTVKGESHGDGIECANTAYDILNQGYCKAHHLRKLELQRDEIKWLPSMLEFYWQNGIAEEGRKFLGITGFITSYDALRFNEYLDAANPYGKMVRAFMLIEGWHVRYLLLLIAAGLFCSICTIAVSTAVSHNFETGLTAGSYACGLATALIAVFTFLSAVL
ncbi:hypothetical protein K469DRAFT_551488 [Zopfia rhizophila CBS 207.26]|uniref:Uncharacterized protein n=1 Tax=Zopfia rhizophila CBS 207.26 TaxID=1314779 RepID=A0A6A6EP89_9PEZI|nr:hypothetical protein K469DRAFT_551488 [Zopfia rhizophila CBS 207.26]